MMAEGELVGDDEKNVCDDVSHDDGHVMKDDLQLQSLLQIRK